MRNLKFNYATLMVCGMLTSGSAGAWAQDRVADITSMDNRPAEMRSFGISDNVFNPGKDFMPQKQMKYMYDLMDENWVLTNDTDYKYDENGNMLEEKYVSHEWNGEVIYECLNYKYDDEGRVIELIIKTSTDGSEYFNHEREVYKYDDVCRDYKIEVNDYIWDDAENKWIESSESYKVFRNDIERDGQNRITSMTKSELVNGEMRIYEKLVVNYEGDGHAKSIWVYKDGNDYPHNKYEDIEWQKSDDNFVLFYNDRGDEPLKSDSANVLKKFTQYYYDKSNGEYIRYYDVNNSFDEKDRPVKSSVIIYNKKIRIKALKYVYDIDENGSYIEYYASLESIEDLENDDVYYDQVKVVSYDENGMIIQDETNIVPEDGDPFIISGTKYFYTFDEDDNMTEFRLDWYYPESYRYDYQAKILYSDFYEPEKSGISEAEGTGETDIRLKGDVIYFSNAEGADYMLCDVTGRTVMRGTVTDGKVKVSSVPCGMYIVKICGKTKKLFINK